MILSLIRRDPFLRGSPMLGVTLLLSASVILGALVAAAARRGGPVGPTELLLLGWATVAPMFLLGRSRSRCGVLDLGLPLPARILYAAHLAAILLATGALTAVYVGGVLLVRRMLSGWVALSIAPSAFLLLLLGTVALAAVLVQAPRPSLARLPASRGHVLWRLVVLVSLGALLPFLAAIPAGALIPAIAALFIGLAIGRSVPPAFLIAPREAVHARPGDLAVSSVAAGAGIDVAVTSRALPRRGVAALAILRCLSAGAKEWISYPMILIFGVILGGVLSIGLDDSTGREFRYLYFPMAAYILFALFAPRLSRLQHLDPLPIPRRMMFAGLILPSLAAFLLAVGAGSLATAIFGPARTLVDFVKIEGGWTVTAPLRVYRLAWDGRPPEIGSPWGESHPAYEVALLRGASPALYLPYSAPPGSSPRFVALQISRAIEAVYGAAIPPEEIERRYLVTDAGGGAAGRAERLTLLTDFPDLRPRPGPVSGLLLALVVAPYLLAVAALLRAYRAGVGEWVRQSIVWGLLGVTLVTWIAVSLGMVVKLTPLWILRALVEIPAYHLGRVPYGAALAWVACLVVIAAAYRVAERQFTRMEIPPRPGKYTLIDCFAKDS